MCPLQCRRHDTCKSSVNLWFLSVVVGKENGELFVLIDQVYVTLFTNHRMGVAFTPSCALSKPPNKPRTAALRHYRQSSCSAVLPYRGTLGVCH